jgi:hypothetical protein
MWLGHYEVAFLLAAVGISIAGDALSTPDPLGWTGTAAWTAWLVTLAADIRFHRWQLCERCISHAPALNPQAAVDRWKRALWFSHQRLLQVVLMLVVLGFIFLSGFGFGHHEQPWQYAIDALALTLLAGVTVARYEHGRLQPWCPWCHWGKGGEEEVSPPVPEVPAVH